MKGSNVSKDKNIPEDSAESIHRLYHELNDNLKRYQYWNHIRSMVALIAGLTALGTVITHLIRHELGI